MTSPPPLGPGPGLGLTATSSVHAAPSPEEDRPQHGLARLMKRLDTAVREERSLGATRPQEVQAAARRLPQVRGRMPAQEPEQLDSDPASLTAQPLGCLPTGNFGQAPERPSATVSLSDKGPGAGAGGEGVVTHTWGCW